MDKLARLDPATSRSEIADREYLPSNTSDAEAEAIRSCITLVENRIVGYYETPRQTEYSVRLLAEGIARVTKGLESFVLLIDLTRAHLPSAKVREALREHVFSDPRLRYVAVYTGRNAAINVVARLVIRNSLHQVSFSISTTRDQALDLARRAHN
jgi:hypothetical protein